MTAKSKRTHPLDRDGDGKAGGSLPGNQTAPMAWTRDDQRLIAKLQLAQVTLDPAFTDAGLADEVAGWSDETAQQVEAFADAMTAEGRYQDEAGDERNADGSPIELPPVLARALIGETDQEAGDADDPHADCVHCGDSHPVGVLDHDLCPACVDEAPILDQLDQATDQTASDTLAKEQREAPAYYVNVIVVPREADEPLTFGVETNIPGLVIETDTLADARELGEHFARDLLKDHGEPQAIIDAVTLNVSPEAEAAEQDRAANAAASDTFDAEQVEAASRAGEGAVIGEEGETVADPSTAAAPLDDALVTIPTDTAPVAVRLHELRILVTARRLYKSPEGYSSNYGPPYIDQATIDAWIAAGLAEDVPSAGNMGGVRVTSEGRSALNRVPTDEAA